MRNSSGRNLKPIDLTGAIGLMITPMAIPEHSLEFLAKRGVWGGKPIPTPPPDATLGLIKTTVTEENVRYYVSDTELIERRFLKGATEEFEEKRDTDPFASSTLFANVLDCLIHLLGLGERVKELQIKNFLERKECGNMMEEILKERGVLLKSPMVQFEILNVIQATFQVPIVVENSKGEIFHTHWPKEDYASKKVEVCWLREVPDGYLGIRKRHEELVEKDIWKRVVVKQPTGMEYTIPSIRKKVGDMKEYVRELGIENVPPKAKKNDFIEIIEKSTLFPELFLCV
jgi:hypothetical protein